MGPPQRSAHGRPAPESHEASRQDDHDHDDHDHYDHDWDDHDWDDRPTLLIGSDDRVLAASPAASVVLGRPPEEVVGRDAADVLTLDLDRTRELLASRRERDPSQCQHVEGLTEIWYGQGRQVYVMARVSAAGPRELPESSIAIELMPAKPPGTRQYGKARHNAHDRPWFPFGDDVRSDGSLGMMHCRLDGTIAHVDPAAARASMQSPRDLTGQVVESIVSFEPLHIDEIWSAVIRRDTIIEVVATLLLPSGLLPVTVRAYATHELEAPVAIELFARRPTDVSPRTDTPPPTERSDQ